MYILINDKHINIITGILKNNEDLLSDGYGYYCETVNKTLGEIAISIIENLNKVINKG